MAKHINLTEQEQKELKQLIKSGKENHRVLERARVLWLLDRSQGNKRQIDQVVAATMVSTRTVYNIKARYFAEGLSRALYDKPQPGATPKITGEVEAHLIALACSDAPEGRSRWTLRLLADKLVELEIVDSISHVAVGNVLKKTG